MEDPEARFLVRLDKRVAEGEPENEEPATVVFPMQRYEPPTQAAAAAANATPIVKFVSAEGYTLEARRSPREGLTDLRFLRKLPEGEITLLLDGGTCPWSSRSGTVEVGSGRMTWPGPRSSPDPVPGDSEYPIRVTRPARWWVSFELGLLLRGVEWHVSELGRDLGSVRPSVQERGRPCGVLRLAGCRHRVPRKRRRKIDWLRFLKTEAISDTDRCTRPRSGGIDVNRCEGDTTVLAQYYERFILNLAHRRNPTALGEFWHWYWGAMGRELHSLWDEAGLPDTIDNDRRVPEQEARFAEVLDRCTGESREAMGDG